MPHFVHSVLLFFSVYNCFITVTFPKSNEEKELVSEEAGTDTMGYRFYPQAFPDRTSSYSVLHVRFVLYENIYKL